MSGRVRVATESRTTHLFGAASLAIALLGACSDEPLVEVDLLSVDGDQISSNVLVCEHDALVRIFGEPDLPGDPTSYVEAWNTGRVDRIVELCSAEATGLDLGRRSGVLTDGG